MNLDGFTPVNSGHLSAVKYDSTEQRMTVRFQNGSEYHVHGITPDDYAGFIDAPSQGEHYHQVLKKQFEITRAK